MRRDYFVRDEFGDVWNTEPLPTFNQAFQFKGMIGPMLNSPRTLSISSVPRGEKEVQAPIRTRADRIREYQENGDF